MCFWWAVGFLIKHPEGMFRPWTGGLKQATSTFPQPYFQVSSVLSLCVPKVPSWGLATLTLVVCRSFSLVLGHSATWHTHPQALPEVRQPVPTHDLNFSSGKTALVCFSHPSRQLDWLIHPGVCQKVVLVGAVHCGRHPQHSLRRTQAFEDWDMTVCGSQH